MTATLDRRRHVLAAVRAVPGAHLRALERISCIRLGTLRYHLEQLVAQGAVDAEADRRFRRYYPAAMPAPTRRIWDAVRQRQTRRIVAILLHGPAPRALLAQRLGLAGSTLHAYAKRLQALGIAEERDGGLALCDPHLVAAALEGANPTLLDRLADGAIGLFDEFGA